MNSSQSTALSVGSVLFTGVMASIGLHEFSSDQSMFVERVQVASPVAVVAPFTARSDNPESVFQALVSSWKKDKSDGLVSSIDEMVASVHYQAIIGLGARAVPLILAQLKREGDKPDHWFVALGELTGAAPVPLSDRGRMQKMAAAWLDWGKSRYG